MPARDYSVPQRPSFTPASLHEPSARVSPISVRRRTRMQGITDFYTHLDFNPQHRLQPCSAVYEIEDRSKPSISSF